MPAAESDADESDSKGKDESRKLVSTPEQNRKQEVCAALKVVFLLSAHFYLFPL